MIGDLTWCGTIQRNSFFQLSGGNTLIFVNRGGFVQPNDERRRDTADVRQADDRDPSALLTLWTAIGGAAANFEDLQERSAAGAMPSLVALGQKGALGHSLDELL